MPHPILFVGAGPGDPELITLKGARLLAEADVVVYAGSLVPEVMLGHCRAGCEKVDSAPLALGQFVGLMIERARAGRKVVRLHSGDSSIYGATAEQTRLLDDAGLPWAIIPGVSSFQAAAAALGAELTLPGVSQSVILTRAEGRSTPMPEGESLAKLGASKATLCLFLSATLGQKIQDQLLPHYGAACPVGLVVRASWPDERIVRCTLGELERTLKAEKIVKQVMMIIGPVLTREGDVSKLYDQGFTHGYRRAVKG
jgi:precorrin-4/cobalt-precorrin-4 C11-methyltransferase